MLFKQKICFFIFLLFIMATISAGEPITVIFDETHSQSAGNSDWTIEGGYSDLSRLLTENGFVISNTQTSLLESLNDQDILVIPEPNDPFSTAEIKKILKYVKNGGNLFLIGNHAGADRNGNKYDSVKAFNEFVYHFGFKVNPIHFTQIGLIPVNDNINKGINILACFAGATITPLIKNIKPLIKTKDGSIFSCLSEYGKGKVIFIGDSAIFDDGTGKDGKHLHNVFNSIMYSNKQLALNIFNSLSNKKNTIIKEPLLFDKLKKNSIVVDLAHGNAGADNTEEFMKDVSKDYNVYYNRDKININLLKNTDIFIMYEPNIELTQAEIETIKKDKTTKYIFVGSSNFNALNTNYFNALIKDTLKYDISFDNNQILDKKNSVSGKPWTFISYKKHKDKNYSVVTFSSCSISGGKKIHLSSSKKAYTTGTPKLSNLEIPIISSTTDLRVTLSGFSVFSNYNYRKSIYYSESYKKVLHNTENYIKYLIKSINGEV